MKKAGGKMLRPTFILGLCVTVSGLLWMGLFYASSPGGAVALMVFAGGCLLLQIAAFVGGRRYAKALFWPGALMLLAAPATLWSAFAGPHALYGVTVQLLDVWKQGNTLKGTPLLSWVALPIMVGGILACVVWAVCGLLFLVPDCMAFVKALSSKKMKQALRPSAPAAPGGRPRQIPSRRPGRSGAPKNPLPPTGRDTFGHTLPPDDMSGYTPDGGPDDSPRLVLPGALKKNITNA